MSSDPDNTDDRRAQRTATDQPSPEAPGTRRSKSPAPEDEGLTDIMPDEDIAELVAAHNASTAAVSASDNEATLDGDEDTYSDEDDDLPTAVVPDELVAPKPKGKAYGGSGEDVEEGPTGVVAPPLPVDAADFAALDGKPARAPAAKATLPLQAADFEATSVLNLAEAPESDEQAAPPSDLAAPLSDMVATLEARPKLTLSPATARSTASMPAASPASSSGYLAPIAIGLMASVLISAAGWWLFFRESKPTSTPAATAAPSIDAAPLAPSVTPILAADAAAEEPPAPGENFAISFARRKLDIDRCVADHGALLGDTRTIEFRFRVAPAGTVSRAWISPKTLRKNPLGRCLHAAAMGARFAPQPKTVTFTIPLQVKAQ